MPSVIQLDILGANGVPAGTARISALDGRRAAPLWETQGGSGAEAHPIPAQVLEGSEYLYEFDVVTAGEIRTDRDEVFQRDDSGGRRGRLRPGEHVGLLPVRLLIDDQTLGGLTLEVRSRKLDYMSHYRWMLRDLATTATGIVTERFAPTEALLEPQPSQDEATLYQQFAFLYAFITGPQFEAAIAQILARPHRIWWAMPESRSPSKGLRGGSSLLRQLVGPGPRVEWGSPRDHPLTSLPRSMDDIRSEETIDTAENRFLKFALQHWRSLVEGVRARALQWGSTPMQTRAFLETTEALEVLDSTLGQELFREVGEMRRFPSSSSVLQGREGYKELFIAYVQAEVASRLTWDGGADVFGAGVRDVATLYEYWTFLQLVEVVRKLCPQHDVGALIQLSADRMSLNLRRGRAVVVKGTLFRHARRLDIELFFNKTFSPLHQGPLDGSWSTPLRPDCSIRVTVSPGTGTEADVVWMHFDAKYRVERLQEVLGREIASPDDAVAEIAEREDAERRGNVKVADLLKMHAYISAIRRASGAFVMYPGSASRQIRRFAELLPGLGAFPLMPTETGVAEGASSIETFLDDACTHLANQASQEERSRYWTRVVYELGESQSATTRAIPLLSRPPADTPVLVTPVQAAEVVEQLRAARLYRIPDELASSSFLPLSALGADLLIARGADSAFVWRMQPYQLRVLAASPDSFRNDQAGRLAVELSEGPFSLDGLVFPLGTENGLLAGHLVDFLGGGE